MKKPSSIDLLNEELAKQGITKIKDIDDCPERTEYLEHLDIPYEERDDKWGKKLKWLTENYLQNFYKYVGIKYPYLLYEKTNDKIYWIYNEKIGIYEELTFPEVRTLVIQLLIDEEFISKANETFAKNVLNKYRSVFKNKGKRYDEFDVDDGWFHVKNGWLKLSTKEFIEHTPERISRKVSAVDYDPKAVCPLYNSFLDSESKLPRDVVRVIDQFSGYILQNNRPIKKMLIFHGKPGSGKSMIPELWCEVLGSLSVSMSLKEIGGSESRFNKDLLVGTTFCFIDEANPKTKDINESFQTLVTKPNFLVERKAIQEKVTIKNITRFVLCLNEMPDHMPPGMDRRYRYIKFCRSFRDEGIEDESIYESMIANELSGILNRMLKGYDDFKKMGILTSIADEEEYKKEYSIAADDFSAFLYEHFDPVNDDEVRYSYSQMYYSFISEFPKPYNKQLSIQSFNKKLFSNRLPEFSQINKGRSRETRGYVGFKLKPGHEFSIHTFEKIKTPHESEW